MCLIVFAYQMNPEVPLILLANRDEFYDRPTKPAGFWEDAPEIFAGRDLVFGGTWLGITTAGRFAALTNFREQTSKTFLTSRGQLVSNFLKGEESGFDYLHGLRSEAESYAGFNLIAGEFSEQKAELFYYSNRSGEEVKHLESGVYGLSNSLLDTPWQKVEQAKAGLREQIGAASEDSYFQLLQDKQQAADAELPDTGIGIEWERILSSIFIETPIYGTRSSSLVIYKKGSRINLVECVYC